jgi:O-antigen ligase
MERLAFSCGLPATAVDEGRTDEPAAPAVVVDARVERQDNAAFKALLAFTFVLFVRPQDTLPFLEPFHLADVTATIAAFSLIAGRLGRGAPLSRVTPELLAVLALGGVMLATAPFSLWPGGAVAVFTDLFVKVILVFVLMVNTITTRERFERLVNIVVLGTSYIAVRAIIDYGRGMNMVEGSRVQGTGGLFGNPNDMALNMIAFLPLAVMLALGQTKRVLRLVAFVGIPAITAAVIFSKSRGGTVGLIAMLLVLVYQVGRLRPVVAALVIAASLAALPLLPSSFTSRMSSIFNADEDPTGSREARKTLLREGYQAFLDHPAVGLGAGQFMNYRTDERQAPWRETHNAVLQVAAELGVGGLIVFVIVISSGFVAAVRTGKALRRARQKRRKERASEALLARREPLELYAAALIASLTGWLVAAMFASVAYYWTLYLVLALATALRDIAQRELVGAMAPAKRRMAA